MSSIYTLLGFAAALFLVLLGVWRVLKANRAAQELERAKEELREKRKQELMDAVNRAQQKKDEAARVRDAIYKDPKRAGEIISKWVNK